MVQASQLIGDKPFDGDALHSAITSDILLGLQSPNDKAALPSLTLYALGYPTNVDSGSVRLNPLQSLLISLNISTSVAAYKLSSLLSAAIRSSKVVIAKSATSSEKCTFSGGEDAVSAVRWITPWIAEKVVPRLTGKTFPGAVSFINKLNAVMDLAHAKALFDTIRVTSETKIEDSRTHYGPAGHKEGGTIAGKKMFLRVQVFQTVHPFAMRVNCGSLGGLSVPDYGGVPNVPIDWNRSIIPGDGYNVLAKHGTINADSKTDASGIATLEFTP